MIATRSRLMARLSGQGAMALLELDAEATEVLIAGYPAGDGCGVRLAASDGDRRAARPGGRGDRGGIGPGPVGAPGGGRRRLAPPDRSIRPARTAQCARRFGAEDTDDAHPEHCRRCGAGAAVRCRPLGGQPAPAGAVQRGDRRRGASTPPSSKISPHPLLTHAITDTMAENHHHSIGTLQRDTHDTADVPHQPQHHAHQPPATHRAPPEPHPVLPATPWHHTRHWITGTARPLRWCAPSARHAVSRIRRTAPGCGKARSVRMSSGSVITASTTHASCPGLPTPSWRSPL